MSGFADYGLTRGGRWTAELHGCALEIISQKATVTQALQDSIETLGGDIHSMQVTLQVLEAQGLAGSIVSPSAMFTIHTGPSQGVVSLDLYFYHPDADPEAVVRWLARAFQASDYTVWRNERH